MRSDTVLGFLLLLAAPLAHAQETPAAIPPVLYQEAYEQPVWVSESALASEPGLLPPALPPGLEEIVRDWPEEGDCIEVVVHTETFEAETHTALADLVTKAYRIVRGVVVGWEAGLFQSTPGTLLRFRPQETIHGALRVDDQFVFVPVGEVRVGGKRLCSADPRFPYVPDVGGEVILVVPPHWFNDGEILFVGVDRGFLPIKEDRVVLPKRFGTSPDIPRGRREFVRWLRDAKAWRRTTDAFFVQY